MFAPFIDGQGEPLVRGYLHSASQPNGDGIVLAHGAGANCQAKLLVEVCSALAEAGFTVLRIDLPFRIERPTGPPRPGCAARDREGLRRAAGLLKEKVRGRLFIGGHSYGGRQASMLLAEEPGVADGLLLLSYPLHPPKKPMELRTKHFPELARPAFFAHGTRDPFGSLAEMTAALKLLPASHQLLAVQGAAHDLQVNRSSSNVGRQIAEAFVTWVARS